MRIPERSLETKLDPATTALVVVDMQHDFCSPGGFVDAIGGDLTAVPPAVASIRQLLDAARAGGVHVVHVRSWFDVDYLNEPMRERLGRMGVEPYCVSGTRGAEFLPELAPLPGETVIEKHRYSGFYETPLDTRLRGRGVENVVVCGTATNNCVDGTARDAFYRGYYVVLVPGAACAPTVALHDHALKTALHAYAVVADVDTVAARWQGAPVAEARA